MSRRCLKAIEAPRLVGNGAGVGDLLSEAIAAEVGGECVPGAVGQVAGREQAVRCEPGRAEAQDHIIVRALHGNKLRRGYGPFKRLEQRVALAYG